MEDAQRMKGPSCCIVGVCFVVPCVEATISTDSDSLLTTTAASGSGCSSAKKRQKQSLLFQPILDRVRR
eukprot:3717992-Amphidinium_carterae.1